MNKKFKISIIVCTYNRADILEDSLLHLIQQDYPKNLYEILIINNRSTDNTATLVQNIISQNATPKISYIYEEKQGLSHARNRGLKEASGEFVAFIDDDGLARPNWLKELMAVFEKFGADAVGGKVDLKFLVKTPIWLTEHFFGWLSIFKPSQKEPYQIYDKPWPVGCNMAFNRAVLLELGGFNPDLGRKEELLLAGEETALFINLINKGGKFYIAPTAVVEHIVDQNRLTKNYFINLQKGLILTRSNYYHSLSPEKRTLLALKTIFEIICNSIAFLLTSPFSKYRFTAYLYLYRSIIKLKTILD